jgi:hypothetical protein
VQIVDTLTLAPGDCTMCHKSRKIEHLDTGIDTRRGRLYLCKDEFSRQQWEALQETLQPQPEPKPTFDCPQCPDKMFTSQQALNGHVSAHKRRGEWEGE